LIVADRKGVQIRRSATEAESMFARLVDVIYWGCCVLAALWLAYFLFGMRTSDYRMELLFSGLVGAALIWLVGRAIRYVLAGK
jgi:branched-subunit amino acid transport protein